MRATRPYVKNDGSCGWNATLNLLPRRSSRTWPPVNRGALTLSRVACRLFALVCGLRPIMRGHIRAMLGKAGRVIAWPVAVR